MSVTQDGQEGAEPAGRIGVCHPESILLDCQDGIIPQGVVKGKSFSADVRVRAVNLGSTWPVLAGDWRSGRLGWPGRRAVTMTFD